MQMTRATFSILTLVTMAACTASSGVTVSGNRCDLSRHQALVGRNVGEVVLPQLLRYREISPGEVVTQDYQPERLNIFVDPKGWVARVSCG